MKRHPLFLLLLSVAAPAAAPAAPPLVRVDDFDDLDLQAASRLSWTAIGDWLIGGQSTGAISIVRLPRGGALRLDGHLPADGAARGRAFAGAWIALGEDGLAVDLSGYHAIRFRARGTAGGYVASVRRVAGGQSANLSAPFTAGAGAEWTVIEIPLAELRQTPPPPPPGPPMAYAPDGVRWLGIGSGPATPSDFHLEIDDVELVPIADAEPAAATFTTRKVILAAPRTLAGLTFASVGTDGRGDGVSPRLPDAKEVALAVDDHGRVWFRIALHDTPPDGYFGLNVALDVDGDPANGMAWWGQNKGFHFDRLLTAYLTRGAGYWQGVAGVADAAAVTAGRMDAVSTDVQVVVDRAARTLTLGVPRAALGLAPDGRVRLVATVGSSMTYSDDTPADGALEAVIPVP